MCKYCMFEKVDDWCHKYFPDFLRPLWKPFCDAYDRHILGE